MEFNVLFTCEHAGNEIPQAYDYLFYNQDEIINSHRGWDPGAWDIASFLAQELIAPLYGVSISRLVVEVNRSIDHAQLFSEFTNGLSDQQKKRLLHEYYFPYRTEVEKAIQEKNKPLLHLSVHTFTPVWQGQHRQVDIGILYDPSRKLEHEFCINLQSALQNDSTGLIIKLNEPYHGTDDGFTTYLRTKFVDTDYLGIEIEINQRFKEEGKLSNIKDIICLALQKTLA